MEENRIGLVILDTPCPMSSSPLHYLSISFSLPHLFLHFQLFSSPRFPPLFLTSLPLLAAMGDTFSPSAYLLKYTSIFISVCIIQWKYENTFFFFSVLYVDILYQTVITNKTVQFQTTYFMGHVNSRYDFPKVRVISDFRDTKVPRLREHVCTWPWVFYTVTSLRLKKEKKNEQFGFILTRHWRPLNICLYLPVWTWC